MSQPPLYPSLVCAILGAWEGMTSSDHNFNSTLTMRKIESQMNAAINHSQDWTMDNTSVSYNEENDVSVVRLHGTKIAEVGEDYLKIFDGGYQSKTTKSRLNAIISEFCNVVTDGVFQKKNVWYISDNNVVKEFTNGYTFA